MNNRQQPTQQLSDADNFLIGLQKNLINRNSKLSMNDNVDFMSNSRSNSYKKVVKPLNNNTSSPSMNNLGFDRASEGRSNTYHFGNTQKTPLNVNYWMNSDKSKLGDIKEDYNNGLHIYDDEDDDEDYDDNFDEDEDNLNNTGFNYNNQYIDLNRVKYNNSDFSKGNMKLDEVEDTRGDTISKPLNTFAEGLDNMLLATDNNSNNYMNYIMNDDTNQKELFGSNESKNNNTFTRLSASDIFNIKDGISVKPEAMNENEMLNDTPLQPSPRADNVKIEPNNQAKSSIEKIKKKKRVKVSHNVIEQKYRDNINEKILKFKDLVPALQYCSEKEDFFTNNNTDGATENVIYQPDPFLLKRLDNLDPAKKLSKAIILGKTYEYIEHLEAKVERYEMLIKNYEQVFSNKVGNVSNSSSNNNANANNTKHMHTPISSFNQSTYSSAQQNSIPPKPIMAKSNSTSSGDGSISINSTRAPHIVYQNQKDLPLQQQPQMPTVPRDIRGPSLYYDNIPINPIPSTATSQSMTNSNNLSVSSMNSLTHYDSFNQNHLNNISHGLDSAPTNRIQSPLNNKMLRNPSSNNTNLSSNNTTNQFGNFFDMNSPC